MGKLYSSIFGGGQTKESSSSGNLAYPQLSSALGGVAGSTGSAVDAIKGMLGLGGSDASNQAFNNYKDSTGYQNTVDTGSAAISNNQAARGLLGSGSTLKRISDYGQQTAQSFYDNYMKNLLNLGGLGVQAGGVLGDAGRTSSQTSNSYNKKGLPFSAGAGAGAGAGGG